jgi:hypothetical protein
MAASPYPVASPLTQEDFNYLEAASRPAMPLSLEDMTSSYELFKTLKKEGAFKGNVAKAEGVIDTGVEAGKMIWEGGSHLLSDIFSWDEDEEGNVTALGMLPYWGRDAFRRVTGGRTNQQIAEAEATAQQTGGNVLLNWKHLKTGGGRVIDRMMMDDDSEEDLQSSYKYWKRVAELEKQRAGVAVEYAKDDDWKTAGMQPEIVELMASGKATPDQKAAMGGSLIMDPVNWIPFGVAAKALGVGGRGTLTGANRALIQDTLKMISQQRALEQVAKAAPGSVQGGRVGGRAGLQAGREAVRAGEAIQVLERKIAENAAKLAPIAKKRDIGLRAFAEGLEEGSPARLMIENALEGVPIKSSAPLAATVVGGATVAAGKTAENIGSVLDFLSTIAPETAITLLGKFGMSEEAAASLMQGSASKWGMRGAAGAGAFALLGADEDDVLLAMATALGPAFLSRYGRDMALAGREMMKAEQYLPYFRRLRSTNPERLIDQAIDRTTLGSTYGSSFRRSYGAAEGGLKRRAFGLTDETGAIGKLGPGSAQLARFLDDSKLGRIAETGGRIGAATIPAAGIGAGFGYVAGGGEDIDPTLQGLGMGLTLGMGGAAFGHFRRFDDPAQLVKARYGDWLHFKDNYLPAGQKEAYFKLPREKQLAMASMQLRHPDLVMHFENKGKDGSPGHHYVEDQTSHIAINVDSPRALEFVLSHEIIHDIDKRGGMQKFDDILIGNPLTEQPGVYSERVTPETKSKYPDLEIGEPILIGEAGSPTNPRRYKTNSDFEALRKDYGEPIGATEGAEGVVMTDHRTVREIVAEHGPDFLLKDKRRYRDLHEGPLGAMMRTLMETELVQNRPLLKNLIGILGGGFRPEGPLMADNAIFGKLRRTPAVTELIRKYNRKLEGLDPETRAKKFPLPESENTFEVKGADFAKHPGLQDLLRAGTFFRVNQDGTLSTSHAMTPRERTKYNKSFSEALKIAIEDADAKGELSAVHVRPSAKVEGAFEGTFLSDKVIDAVEQAGGWSKEQIGLLRNLNEKLKSGEGNEYLISYFKATTKGGRKYVNAKVEHLTEVPYGIEITKAGNINFRTVSIDQLVKNVEKLVRTQKAEVSRLYGSDEALAKDLILDDLDTYHRNHAAGRPGATGLHADPQIAEARRNLLNSAFGEGRKGQLDANPWLAGLTGSKATRPVYRSRRIERIGKVVQLSGKRPISYEKIAENFMPRRKPNQPDDTIPLPFDELPGDKPGEGFGRMINVDRTKAEMAEAKRLADEAQDGFSSSGNVRSKDAYGRDKLFMPARNAAKKSINRRQVLKLLSLAPFAPSIALKTTKMVGKRFPVKDREHLLALKEELEGFRQNLQDDNLMESPNYEDILSIQEKVDKLLVSKVVPKEIEFSSNFEAEFAHDAWDNVATFNENKNWPEPPEIFQKSSRPSEANFDNILASLADILQDSPLNDSIKAKIDKLTLDEILRLLEGKQVELKAESGIIPIQIESGKIEVISNRGTFDAGDPNMLFMPAAYHGTPHTFKAEEGAPLGRFRSAQIGTGEGAQAYGHGLYFAGSKEVGEFYRSQLSPSVTKDFKLGTMNIIKNEVPIDYSPHLLEKVYGAEAIPRAALIESLLIDEGTIKRAFLEDGKRGAEREIKKVIKDFLEVYEDSPSYQKVGEKALKMPINYRGSETGSLYKVELAPKENKYLLWDKPLSEQPKGVREKLEAVSENLNSKMFDGFLKQPDKFDGNEVYGKISDQFPGTFGNVDAQAAASAALREAGIPGIKYLDGSSRSKGKGDYNYVIFDEADVAITDKLFMPAAKPESVSPNTVREGDVVRLNEESLRLFMPASDKVRLEDYADRKMFALASDRLGIGRMLTGPKGKKKELTIDAQGGRGFMQIFNGGGWAFKGKQTADNFIKRVKDVAGGDDSVVVGITILSDLNHLHSAYGQLAYTNALRAAIESGTITEGMANRQIREIVKRIKQAKTKKPLPAESRKVVEAIKNFADFEKAVKAKKINFNLMAKVREKAEGKTLPLTATEAAKLELDVPSIAKDIADPELVGADFGKVVALLEVPVNQTPKKTDFHYSYPYTIEGHKIGFLEEFADVGELTSDPKVRTKQGRITAQPLQTVMPEFDRLRGNRFMPAK